MNHSLYQDGILKPLPFKRLPCLVLQGNRLNGCELGSRSLRKYDS